MSTILHLVRFRMWSIIAMILFRYIIFSLSFQIVGLLTRAIFDGLAEGRPAAIGPYALCALIVVTALVRSAVIFADIPLHFSTFFSFGALLRRNLFEYILDQPGARALPDSAGEAISRFRGDVDQVSDLITQFPFTAAMITFPVVAFFILMKINSTVTLVVFLPMVTIIVIIRLLGTIVERYRKASRDAAGTVTGFIGDLFGAIEAVKTQGVGESLIKRFRILNDNRQKVAVKDSVLSTGLSSIFGNIINIGTGVVLLLVASSMKSGTFTVGDFALFVYYLGVVTGSIIGVGEFLVQMRQTRVSIGRLFSLQKNARERDLVDHKDVYIHGKLPDLPRIRRKPRSQLKILSACNLTYLYPGTDRGVRDVSIEIRPGTLTVVTGRIGSGKSTLLRALLGLLPLQRGEIRWNGQLIENPATFMVPPRTSYTPQVPRLFSDTLKNNILLGLYDDEVDMPAALHQAVMEQDIRELETGIETLVGPKGVKLSGGQKQRAAAARMHIRQPDLLVFDDMSSALDIETESLMWDRLLGDSKKTCLAVSHRPAVLKRADHILVLKGGILDAHGSLTDLKRISNEFRAIYSETNGEIYGPNHKKSI